MNAIVAAAVIGGASLAGGKRNCYRYSAWYYLMVLINNAGVQFGLNTHVLEITKRMCLLYLL